MAGTRGGAASVLVALLALEGLLGLYGIDQPVRWGHQGYHVAEHGLGARNLRRHGSWTFTTYHAEGAPPSSSLEFHHPVMLQVPVAAAQSVLGEAPFTARAVGLAFSFVAVACLYWFWRRARDARQAAVAAGFFILSPMHVAFANLPDVEILGIAAMCAWGAVLVHFRDHPTRRGAVALVALSALGALTDWAWHPIFWLTLLLLWAGARVSEGPRLPGRILVAMAAVAALVLVQHFVRAAAVGRLDDLLGAYHGRSARSPLGPFLALAARRLLRHHTLPILLASVAWLAHAAARRRDAASLLVGAWIVAQVAYVFAFPNEFEYHEYRSHWLVAPFACVAADAIHALERRLGPFWPRAARWAPVLALALLVTRSLPMWVRSRAVSGSTSATSYDPHDGLMTAARLAHAWTPRGTPVLVGGQVGERLEVHWLLDRPSWTPRRTQELEPLLERYPSVIVLDDRAALQSSPEWRRALRSAAVLLVDQVALAVFRRGGTASVEHVWPRAGRAWGPLLAYLRAPVRAPTCLAPGDPEVAALFARDLGLPEPVVARARAGRAPLARTLPAAFRCDAQALSLERRRRIFAGLAVDERRVRRAQAARNSDWPWRADHETHQEMARRWEAVAAREGLAVEDVAAIVDEGLRAGWAPDLPVSVPALAPIPPASVVRQ